MVIIIIFRYIIEHNSHATSFPTPSIDTSQSLTILNVEVESDCNFARI